MKKPESNSDRSLLASETGRRWLGRSENILVADRLRTPSVTGAGARFVAADGGVGDSPFRLRQPSRCYSKTRTGFALWDGFGVTVFERAEQAGS